jgi:molecular chaperone DnaK
LDVLGLPPIASKKQVDTAKARFYAKYSPRQYPQLAKAVDDSIRKLDSLGRIKRTLPSGSVGHEEAQRLRRLLQNLEKKRSEGAIGEAVYAKLRNEYYARLRSLPPEREHILGIDFGTSYAAVAVVMNGRPVMIPIPDAITSGAKGIPSCVAITDHGESLVGEAARKVALRNPDRVFNLSKRHLGTTSKVVVDDNEYAPEQVVALILGKLKHAAEDFLGENVDKAVVAVPSCFNMFQMQQMIEAGRIAGLQLVRLIGEATAVSLAYGLDRGQEERIVVIDLGGGKIDVAIVSLGGGVIQVRATSGDAKLGAVDIDEAVVEYLAGECRRRLGVDPSVNKIATARLKEVAEKARIELSTLFTTEIDLPYIMQDKHLHVTLTRTKLEELALPIVERIRAPIKRVIEDAKLSLAEIDKVILAGGSIRMPLVQRFIRDTLGDRPRGGVDPLEAVTMGAAIQGAVIAGEVKDLLLLDVNYLSLGVETLGGIFTRVMERNTTIPTKRSQVFSTAADFQTSVTIHVLQGERSMASDNVSLGMFNLVGIPPARSCQESIHTSGLCGLVQPSCS